MSSGLCWIHCNKCYAIFVRKKATFFLLSCAHIFCHACLEKCVIEKDQRQCLLCKKSVASKEICPEMTPRYKRFFNTTPGKNGIDWEVLSFQTFHFKNFCKGMSLAEQFLEEAKNELKQMYDKTIETGKVFEELNKETARLDAKVAEYKDDGTTSDEYPHTNLNNST